MKGLAAYAILATIAAAVFAILFFTGKADRLQEVNAIRAQITADSVVTAAHIARRDSLLTDAARKYKALLNTVLSRRPTKDRVNDAFNGLKGAAVNAMLERMDADLPTVGQPDNDTLQ